MRVTRGAWTRGIALLAVIAALCAGCTGQGSAPTPTPSVSPTASVTPRATPTATPDAGPRFFPDGTAEENLPFFDEIVAGVWAGSDRSSGRAYIDALVAAGFPKDAMQLTADQTTIGNPADTIEFSVRWDGECLIGQAGPEVGGAFTVILPVLADDRCLIGATRPIDW